MTLHELLSCLGHGGLVVHLPIVVSVHAHGNDAHRRLGPSGRRLQQWAAEAQLRGFVAPLLFLRCYRLLRGCGGSGPVRSRWETDLGRQSRCRCCRSLGGRERSDETAACAWSLIAPAPRDPRRERDSLCSCSSFTPDESSDWAAARATAREVLRADQSSFLVLILRWISAACSGPSGTGERPVRCSGRAHRVDWWLENRQPPCHLTAAPPRTLLLFRRLLQTRQGGARTRSSTHFPLQSLWERGVSGVGLGP